MLIRNLLFAGLSSLGMQAQGQTWTVVVNGTLSSCDSSSTVVVQDILSLFADSLPVGPGCTFSTTCTVGMPQGFL